MSKIRRVAFVALLAAIVMLGTASAQVPYLLNPDHLLQGATGSTVGPDGALYVPEAAIGVISRVDPWTGDVTTFWEGLPQTIPAIGLGGTMDVAFLDGVAYALVTLVGGDVGGTDTVGIYRMDGPSDSTAIADIGAFAIANPPSTDFFVPSGVQYAMETFRGGFLVTDGHHNRVLRVRLDGAVSELIAFDNVVPTGLAIHGNRVYMAELGPTPPNLPEDGRVVAFDVRRLDPWEVVSGVRMMVDVERGLGRTLYALGQGVWDGVAAGSPALPNTGELVQVNGDGSFTPIASGLNQPTSMEFIGNTVFIVGLAGEIWVIEDVSSPPFGRRH